MFLSLKKLSHESPKIQAPKDAGVVFSNHVLPIRFTLNFKPWFFLCLVGFTGSLCAEKGSERETTRATSTCSRRRINNHY
eukprot:XP_763795.1 hypothetical protein [Theileria parva strain Muguga]